MRIVLQRAASASVTVDGEVVGAIGPGLVALVGVAAGDDRATAERAADKTAA
ncbi:MAG: D-aminoacyl-tRNA deacylase, partial [Actinomycetota bacterium]